MFCPKCGNKIIGLQCDKCGFDLKKDDFFYFGALSDDCITEITEHIIRIQNEEAINKAKEDAERKANEFRMAKEKAERKANEFRMAKERAERDSEAFHNAMAEAGDKIKVANKAKEEAERKANEFRIAKEKAEDKIKAANKAKEEAERKVNEFRIAKEKAEEELKTIKAASITEEQKKHKKRVLISLGVSFIVILFLNIFLLFNGYECIFTYMSFSLLVPYLMYWMYSPVTEWTERKLNVFEKVSTILFGIFFICFVISLFSDNLLRTKIFWYIFGIAVPCLTADYIIRYLKYLNHEQKFNKQICFPFEVVAAILCLSLSVLLLFGVNNKFKEIGFSIDIAETTSNANVETEETSVVKEDAVFLKAGDVVTLGHYEQDLSNDEVESITWNVMKVNDGKALLVCEKAIEVIQYNEDETDNSWTNSTIRNWLNGKFIDSAFSEDEQLVICNTELKTEKWNNSLEAYSEYENTTDKIFIPTKSEYYKLKEKLNASDYAIEKFGNISIYREDITMAFWVRTPYENDCTVYGFSAADNNAFWGFCTSDSSALVRPSMYIDIDLYATLK